MSAQIRVKDFGKSIPFNSIEDMRSTLQREYTGKSVSVVIQGAERGNKKLLFISVTDKGVIEETYGEKKTVNFSELSSYLH